MFLLNNTVKRMEIIKVYFQVLIEIAEKVGKTSSYKKLFELDKADLSEIEDDIVIPYLKGEKFQFDGYFINASEVKRLVIKQTEKTTEYLSNYENNNMPPEIIMYISREDIMSYDNHTTDITKQVITSARLKLDSGDTRKVQEAKSSEATVDCTKVFIVHGHDDLAKSETARFVEKMGFEPIILHEQASGGKTIIEKIEEYSNVGFGVVLYTPCDVGGKAEDNPNLKLRARQNVVFEHGYLIGKLGRKKVCALVKNSIETPNDISGVVYVPMDPHGAWKIALAKEMRSSGYNVDMNLVI